AERLAHARSRRRLRRAPVDRQQSANQSGAGDGESKGDRSAARLCHKQGSRDPQLIERAADPLRLCREGVVRVFGVRRPAVAERLDDDALVAASGQRAGDRAIAEGGAEDAGDEDQRLSRAYRGGSQRFPGRDFDVANDGAVWRTGQERQGEEKHGILLPLLAWRPPGFTSDVSRLLAESGADLLVADGSERV